jgi:hypothetical protein
MVIDNLPHRVIQTSKSVKYKDLDADIKQTIVDFENEYSTYLSTNPDLETDPAYPMLLQKSDNIGEYIYINYVDHADDVEYEIEDLEDDNDKLDTLIKNIVSSKAINIDNYVPSNKDEQVLHEFWLSDKRTNITKGDLGASGFDIGFWSILGKYGCVCGRYILERRNNEQGFKLRLK